jgi:spore germination protein
MRYIQRTALLAMLSGVVYMTGCSPFVDNNLIEEIAPVIFWSITDGGAGQLNISTLVPPLINEKKRLLTMQVSLLKEGRKEFNLKYYRELKPGQLRVLLISEELAKQGVLSLINTYLIDPDISPRLYIGIVQGNVVDYIKNQLDKQENLDYFIYRMFTHYDIKNQGELTVVNLHQFEKKLHPPFSDPILPVFKVNSDNFIYEGTAFFYHDKLIATVKKMDEQIFQLLDNDHYLKTLSIPDLSVAIGQARSKVHMKLNRDFSSISIKVDLNGRIEEYRGDKSLLNPVELAELNNQIKFFLEKQTMELLKKMQQWKVDPLQIGILSLNPFAKPISEKEWLSHWEQMKIVVDYRLHIQPLTNVK